MIHRNLVRAAAVIAGLCVIGCVTGPKLTPVPYTFGAPDAAPGAAAINFADSVRFVDFEGEELPAAAEGARWYPVRFPAGRDFTMKVSAYGRMMTYASPPLAAGTSYKLWFEGARRADHTAERGGKLILTYDKVRELKYFLGAPLYKQIYVLAVPRIAYIPYTFAAHENAPGTVKIMFRRNIRFVDCEDEALPEPAEDTVWSPLLYPAGRAFNLRLYVMYHGDRPGYRRRGVLKAPPLEAGKTYKLWYEAARSSYYSGAGRLILTEDNVQELKYSFGKPRYKQIYVQEIPPL